MAGVAAGKLETINLLTGGDTAMTMEMPGLSCAWHRWPSSV